MMPAEHQPFHFDDSSAAAEQQRRSTSRDAVCVACRPVKWQCLHEARPKGSAGQNGFFPGESCVMPRKVWCPQCQTGLQVPDQAAGKSVRCPRCQTTFLVPTVAGPEEPPDTVAAPASASAAARGASSTPPPSTFAITPPTPAGGPPLPAPEEIADSSLAAPPGATEKKKRKRKKKRAAGPGLFGIPFDSDLFKAIAGGAAAVVLIPVALLLIWLATRTAPPDELPASTWEAFEVPGRCKVLLPGKPKRETQTIAGVTLIMHSVQPDKDSVFGIGYTEGALPEARRQLPPEQILNDSCDGSAKNLTDMGGKEVHRGSINLGDIPGKELVMYISKARGHMISRCYLVNGRLFILMCGGTGYDRGQANVNKFFDSFEVKLAVEVPAPPPAPVPAPRPRPPRTFPAVPPGPVVVRPRPEVGGPGPVGVPPRPPEPPRVARLELPPLPSPIEIQPPPIKAETSYKLPESVRSLCVGGGGRFLVLHFPKVRKFGIFDVNEAKIVRYVPAAEDDVRFAAGMTKLVVYLPGTRIVQRYNLLTGEREHLGKLDLGDGKLDAFCMGHASAGPLLICDSQQGGRLFDIGKFEAIPLPTADRGGVAALRQLPGGLYWAGATGRVFGYTGNYGMPNGVGTVVFEGGEVHQYGQHKGTWFVMPGPDDHHVFAAGHGVVSERVQPVPNAAFSMGPGSENATHLYLPAHHGPYYLHAETIGIGGSTAKVGTIRIYMLGNKDPIARFEKTAVCRYGWDGLRGLGIEHSIHLVPKAKLLMIVPESRDELRLYPTDLDAALERSGVDYLLFTSTPPARFQKGKDFSYRAEVQAKHKPVTFKLDGGPPPGMRMDASGKVTWSVPADFAEARVDVILSATDAKGQEAFQTLTLTEGGGQ
jgi:predicted Zn finger-like uncharacterized protein